jgi:cytidylate kinase
MSLITVSRQLGSLGSEITRQLCQDFAWPCLDKESLEEAFSQYGLPRESIERFDEKKPGFWDLFKTDKARYLHFMKKAIFEFARQGTGIILGRGGQILLADLPGVLHVRVIAPMAVRKKRLMKRFECDAQHAEKILRDSDYEKDGFHKFFFGESWENASLYDLVINTGSFPAQTAAGVIKHLIVAEEFKAVQEETRQKIADLCLEHQIKTVVIYQEKIVVQFLEVVSERGIVTLRGITDHSEDLERCAKVAAQIPEVKKVDNQIYYSPLSTAYGIHY